MALALLLRLISPTSSRLSQLSVKGDHEDNHTITADVAAPKHLFG